jgi:hypothetical protein
MTPLTLLWRSQKFKARCLAGLEEKRDMPSDEYTINPIGLLSSGKVMRENRGGTNYPALIHRSLTRIQ